MSQLNENGKGLILEDGTKRDTHEHHIRNGIVNVYKCDYNNKYCLPIHRSFKYQVIKSPMKTGKTYQVIDFLKECVAKGLSFLITSPRITFARDITSRLKESGVNIGCYLNSDDKEDDNPGYCISAESMFKLKRIYDVVIIDECESFLNQFSSGLHSDNLDRNREMITMQIQSSKHTIAMDADADIRIFTYLQDIITKDITKNPSISNEYHLYYSENQFKAETDMHCYMKPLNDTIYKLHCILTNTDSNVQIVLGSKDFGLKTIEPLLIECNINYIFHHGDSDDQTEITKNVNENWKKYRVVMYTSTVGPGVNFDEKHFDYRFVFGTSMSVSVRELFQMKGRVRNISSGEEYVCNSTRKDAFPATYESVVNEIQFKINEDNMKAINAANYLKRLKYVATNLKNRVVWKLDLDNVWVKLHILHIVEVNRSKNLYNYEYVCKTNISGSQYTKVDETELTSDLNTAYNNWIKSVKTIYKETSKTKYDKAKIHDKKDLNKLIQTIKDGKASAVQKLELNKSLHTNRLLEGKENSYESNELYKKKKTQVDNIMSETKLSGIGNYLLEDLKDNPNNITQKRKTSQRDEIYSLLGNIFDLDVKHTVNTSDRKLKVTNFQILERCSYLFDDNIRVSTIFGFKKDEPETRSDWKWLVSFINSILTRWSCCKLGGLSGKNGTTAERIKCKGQPDTYVYNLVEATKGFDALVASVKFKTYNIKDLGIVNPEILTRDPETHNNMCDQLEEVLNGEREVAYIVGDDEKRVEIDSRINAFQSPGVELISDDIEDDVIGPEEIECMQEVSDYNFEYYLDSVEYLKRDIINGIPVKHERKPINKYERIAEDINKREVTEADLEMIKKVEDGLKKYA